MGVPPYHFSSSDVMLVKWSHARPDQAGDDVNSKGPVQATKRKFAVKFVNMAPCEFFLEKLEDTMQEIAARFGRPECNGRSGNALHRVKVWASV